MTTKVTKSGFKEFYDKFHDKFPYNELRVTRSSIHSKWLLMKSKSRTGIMFDTGRLFVTLSQTMEEETVLHLICSHQALPMPDDFSAVLDCMHVWGRSVCFRWYKITLQLFNFYLRYGGVEREREILRPTDLYRAVISLRVDQLLNTSFAGGNLPLYNEWKEYYNKLVNNGETDFFVLACSSFKFLNNKL